MKKKKKTKNHNSNSVGVPQLLIPSRPSVTQAQVDSSGNARTKTGRAPRDTAHLGTGTGRTDNTFIPAGRQSRSEK